MKSTVRAKGKRIRDIDDINNAVKTLRDLSPVEGKYNNTHFRFKKRNT